MASEVPQILPDNQEGLMETQAYKDTLQDLGTQDLQVAEVPTPTTPALSTASDLSKLPSVEAMSWKQLKMAEKGHQYCQHCKQVVELESPNVIRKKSHKNLQCRLCHNIVTLLYRNWDMSKMDGFKNLAEDQARAVSKTKPHLCIYPFLQSPVDFNSCNNASVFSN